MNMMAFNMTGRIFSPNEIRRALVRIAELRNRPYYSLMVQRDVVEAFRSGAYHPLKDAVINTQIQLTRELNDCNTHLYKLREFAHSYGLRLSLARVADMDPVHLSNLVAGNTELTEETWDKLSAAIREMSAHPELYRDRNKQDQCGTYASYKVRKCRCSLCCKAFSTYSAMRRATSVML